jgi:arginase
LRSVPEEDIVLAGARDLDPPEVSYLAGSSIIRRDVADLAPADLPDMPLYVHVDLDVLDPAEVPGLRYPAPDGPTAAQLAGSLQMLMATGRVAAVGLACTWYPGHGAADRLAPYLEAPLTRP